MTKTEQGQQIMNSKKENLEKELGLNQKLETFGTYEEPISSLENIDT